MKADQKIVVSENGPYVVTGSVPLSVQVIIPDKNGFSWEWREGKQFQVPETYKLCRCGGSKTKPFCDGTHTTIGFDGEETATRVPVARQSEHYAGPGLTLDDAEPLCAFARFCDAGGKIWSLIEGAGEPRVRDLVIREATSCPSGRLVVHERQAREAIEPELPPSIGVVEDPAMGCSGPLWVRAGIPVHSADAKPSERPNRVTLRRVGP